MKTKLLTFVLLFSLLYLNSQEIDLIGNGVNGISNPTLNLTNIDNIYKVDAGAFYKDPIAPSGITDVQFSLGSENPTSNWHTPDEIKHHSTPSDIIGSFEASFNTINVSGLNATIVPTDKVHSFYAYIYRDNPLSAYISYADVKTSYYFLNGYDDRYTYKFNIDNASAPRDIKVKVPVSHLDSDNDGLRIVVIQIEVLDDSSNILKTMDISENLNNFGNYFLLREYLLSDVSGNATKVNVSIYSPKKGGDSFFVSGVVVDVEKVYDGCTHTQGYWKNHSNCKDKGPERDDTWDEIPGGEAENTIFFLSEQNYCEVFDTQSNKKNGKYYILAHQYIAAQLNLLDGADPSAIADAFTEATQFLETYSPEDVLSDENLAADCVRLGKILDDYNNGRIGPGHCDDIEENESKVQTSKPEVKIGPNPIRSNSLIKITPKKDCRTVVELYNSTGRNVDVLFNKFTPEGKPVNINLKANGYKKGLYFVKVNCGGETVNKKIVIN